MPARAASSPAVSGPCVGERPVEPQPVPQVDGEHVHRGQGRREEPLDERVANLIRAGHRTPPSLRADAPIMARAPQDYDLPLELMVRPSCAKSSAARDSTTAPTPSPDTCNIIIS